MKKIKKEIMQNIIKILKNTFPLSRNAFLYNTENNTEAEKRSIDRKIFKLRKILSKISDFIMLNNVFTHIPAFPHSISSRQKPAMQDSH